MTQNCNRCSFICSEEIMLFKHAFEAHSYEPNFIIICGVGGCPCTFKLGSTYSSFLNHCNRKHYNWRETLKSSVLTNIQPSLTELQSDPTLCDDLDTLPENESDSSCVTVTEQVSQENETPSCINDSAAQFLLVLKEEY